MKRASISEAKNRLSQLIDRVRGGETVVITDRGRPVALLESIATDRATASEGRLERLERAGIIRRAKSKPPMDLIARPAPRARKGVSIVRAVVDERSESR